MLKGGDAIRQIGLDIWQMSKPPANGFYGARALFCVLVVTLSISYNPRGPQMHRRLHESCRTHPNTEKSVSQHVRHLANVESDLPDGVPSL